MARPEKVRLGDVLVSQNAISAEQLKTALDQQKKTGKRLGRALVQLGYTTEEKIGEALAKQLNLPFVNLKTFNLNRSLAQKLPEAVARRFRAMALEERAAATLVGMADPTDVFAYDEVARALKREIDVVVVSESQLLQSLDQIYRKTDEISGFAKDLERDIGSSVVDFRLLGATLGGDDAPVVKLIQSLFEDAMQVGASDIHIEPEEASLHIRFRIDGVLHLQTEADSKVASAVALRLKLMSGLDISERRLPQDGRFNVRVRDNSMDVRISTLPTQFGESIVMRLLNRQISLLGLEHIGMPAAMVTRFRSILSRASGMVLVTGPTGSGKTTTLYGALSELNTPDRKLITVEDPVEYRIGGLNQVQVHEKIDLTFARVLRSVLRQDPDVILVGEMRDAETANIGLRAAITGHMVLSTLHTREAADAPARLIDMGAPNFMVATSLQAVIGQRLVRLICEGCNQEYAPTDQEQRWLAVQLGQEAPSAVLRKGRGCTQCNATGYRGRTGVYEMLELNQPLIDAIVKADGTTFAHRAQEQLKGKSLVDHGVQMALAGRTTLSEVMRLSQADG